MEIRKTAEVQENIDRAEIKHQMDHLSNVEKLSQELRDQSSVKILCPKCLTANFKLKARIDGVGEDRHIERFMQCTNCNHKVTQ